VYFIIKAVKYCINFDAKSKAILKTYKKIIFFWRKLVATFKLKVKICWCHKRSNFHHTENLPVSLIIA